MNQQRNLIYEQRRQVLDGQNVHQYFVKYIEDIINDAIANYSMGSNNAEEWDIPGLVTRLNYLLGDLDSITELKSFQ